MKLRRFTVAGYAVGLLLGIGLILGYGAMEMSSTPSFCGSCHVMAPYFESWKTSTHADIACVECHIPPGITAEFRKKYEAVSMVARYFTGTYGTNPWAEVDDAACLECHERRLLVGKELFGDVLFDHGPHLAELRRGKRLRCTSCHSQIVQGSHITVTTTTCTLCHFKGQPAGTGTARCTLCHETPERIVDADGLRFDHSDVTRFGMDCLSCHTPPGPQDGEVPRERCLTCHNDPERLSEYENGDLLHRSHVTEHKVECTNCHLEIEHVAPRHLEVVRTECSTCHGSRHSPQRDLYAGLGGKGVPPSPDVMYRAGVRCEGCHFEPTYVGATAGEVSCMSCHGPTYRNVFRGWKETLEERGAATRRQLEETTRLLGSSPPAALADARANLELVEQGRGIHNLPYSLALLEAAHSQINEARRERSLDGLPSPWPDPPYETPCLDCHVGVESRRVKAFGADFPHRPHVLTEGLRCERCHTTHEERDATGAEPLKIERDACSSCHHGDQERDCIDCHSVIRRRTFSTEEGDFDHTPHLDDAELECVACHGEGVHVRAKADREVCTDCH
jgi:nitrate/TMAO reductase-like tetraheme cytochrome c subunit